jgi:hypothetical protein
MSDNHNNMSDDTFFTNSGNSPGGPISNINDATEHRGLTEASSTDSLPGNSFTSSPIEHLEYTLERKEVEPAQPGPWSMPTIRDDWGRTLVEIPVVGAAPAHVLAEDYEFLSQWQWHAVPGPYRTHAIAIIERHCVDLTLVVWWLRLIQGDTLGAGGLLGRTERRYPSRELREMLEEALEDGWSMKALVDDFFVNPDSEPDTLAAPDDRRCSPEVREDNRHQ